MNSIERALGALIVSRGAGAVNTRDGFDAANSAFKNAPVPRGYIFPVNAFQGKPQSQVHATDDLPQMLTWVQDTDVANFS